MRLTLPDALTADTRAILRRARAACRQLATATTAQKNEFLRAVVSHLQEAEGALLRANAEDLKRAQARGRNAAFVDRLRLDSQRLAGIRQAVKEIIELPDPVGHISSGSLRPNGLQVQRVAMPLGVIGIVYESRPNVTIDAGCLCIKAGNAVVLRGGSDASKSNAILLGVLRSALQSAGLPSDAAQAPAVSGHQGIEALVSQTDGLDVIIPRGGKQLIDAVNRWARVPVIQHYEGVCHIYVDRAADLDAAEAIVINAKAQRPGVCNAMEALLIDQAIADVAIPRMVAALHAVDVQVHGCERTQALAEHVHPAAASDRGREFLDLACLVEVVDGLDGALAHIAEYGSGHTEAILTQDYARSRAFTAAVDASCVMVNASTRFNDGGCLGLGAEIGISTTKLHAYGPMGLEALTTKKYVVLGQGHVRD